MAKKKKEVKYNDNDLAIAYYRYSSDSQRDASIEQQQELAHIYAENHGLQIVKEYPDEAESGTSEDRPQYQLMLKEIGAIRPSTLILYKMNRINRNVEDYIHARSIIKAAGCRIVCTMEMAPDTESSAGKLWELFSAWEAENYSEQLSKDIRRGNKYNAERAMFNGHGALGLMKGEDGRYAIDPTTSGIVMRIFDEFDGGKPLVDIAEGLNADGLKTRTGGQFNIHGLRKILKSEKYIGVYQEGDIRIEGGIPPIIGDDQWKRVQERFEKNRRKGGLKPHRERSGDESYWLAGTLYCGECGEVLHAMPSTSCTGKTYHYYACANKRRRRGCHKRDVKKDWIEAAVIELLEWLLADQELLASFAVDAAAYYEQTYASNEYVKSLEAQLRENEKALENLLKAVEAGVITNSTAKRINEREARQQVLEQAIRVEECKAALVADEHSIGAYFKRFAHANLHDEKVRKQLLEYFVKRIYVFDDYLLVTGWFADDNNDYVRGIFTLNDVDVGFEKEFVPAPCCEFDLPTVSSTTYMDRV